MLKTPPYNTRKSHNIDWQPFQYFYPSGTPAPIEEPVDPQFEKTLMSNDFPIFHGNCSWMHWPYFSCRNDSGASKVVYFRYYKNGELNKTVNLTVSTGRWGSAIIRTLDIGVGDTFAWKVWAEDGVELYAYGYHVTPTRFQFEQSRMMEDINIFGYSSCPVFTDGNNQVKSYRHRFMSYEQRSNRSSASKHMDGWWSDPYIFRQVYGDADNYDSVYTANYQYNHLMFWGNSLFRNWDYEVTP